MSTRAQKKIPPQLREHARSLEDLGIAGEAYHADLITAVVRSLNNAGVAILGGDVYDERDGVLIPTYDNWHCDRQAGEPFDRYAERCWDRAWHYTQTYLGKPGQKSYFALVLSDEPTAGM